MKQETVVLVDSEYLAAHPDKMDLVRLLMEFGAPITIEEGEEKPIVVYKDMEFAYIRVACQNAYKWNKEVERGPDRIVIRVKANGLPEIYK